MKAKLSLGLTLAALSLSSPCVGLNLSELNQTQPVGKVHISNRILARINGKPISLLDVTKKLDVVFYREYPQYAKDEQARYEFYMTGWRHALDDIISKELVLADAASKKFPLSQGDVREEMEQTFGPNLMLTLDQMGLTFEEARAMVADDIMLRRMMWFRVNQQAMTAVGPQRVKAAYETLVKEVAESAGWRYHVISIRGDDEESVSRIAQQCYDVLNETEDLSDPTALTAASELSNDEVKVNVSSEYQHTSKTISNAHLEGIQDLSSGQLGLPVAQVSRSGKDKVYRIYYLKEEIENETPSFDEIATDLKDHLIQQEIEKSSKDYMSKLHKEYEIERLISETTSPAELFQLY